MEDVILDDLLNDIIQSRFQPGDPLPSEPILCHRYNVPRTVVRRAYFQLQERGYVRSYQGKGRYLLKPAKHVLLTLLENASFTEKVSRAGLELQSYNHSSELASFNPELWSKLGVAPTERIFETSLLRFVDHEPVAMHTSFLVENRFPKITEEAPEIRSMYEYYSQHGYTGLHSRHFTMSVTLPTLDEQHILGCPSLVPLLLAEYFTYADEQLLSLNKSIYRGDRFKYHLD
jgi:GntR family transcriptional regulator